MTGIAFTDTEALKRCDISWSGDETKELSAEFIYRVIEKYGGPEKFYKKFFITSICPVGFTKNGVNFNYYDEAECMNILMPYIQKTFAEQTAFGAKKTAVVLGRGKNYTHIKAMNGACSFFETILPLDHPRFIMQYRRKKIDEYIEQYINILNGAQGI